MARNPDATVRVINSTDEPIPVDLGTGSVTITGPVTVPVEVGLNAATLAALETINALIGNWPEDYPDAAVLAKLEQIRALLDATLTVDGTVALDAPTLAALEATTATVANFPADYPDAAVEAKLEAIRAILAGTVPVSGTVALDGPTLAALETINAFISGTVGVSNFPALQPVSGPLTDVELRATPVPVSGAFAIDEPVTVDGEVALAAATLAALETIQVGNFPAVQSVDAVNLDIRDLTLPLDSVRQTGRVMTPLSVPRTGPLTDDVLIAVAPGDRLRVLRIAHHVDPALTAGTYPVVTLKVGGTTVYLDKMEPGLPWSEWCCFEGAAGDDLTLTLPEVATVYFNLRYELF